MPQIYIQKLEHVKVIFFFYICFISKYKHNLQDGERVTSIHKLLTRQKHNIPVLFKCSNIIIHNT